MFARLNTSRPTYNEGNTRSSFISTILTATVLFHRSMAVQQFESLILIAVVNNGTIIATEHKDGIICKVQTIQSIHNLAYSPIQLQDYVATGSHAALAGKTGMRYARNVYVLCTHIHEERLVFMFYDKVFGFTGDDICNVFIYPKSRFPTGHPADTRNTVYDCIIMPLAGFQFYEFGIFQSGRPVTYFMVVIDGNGVVGI